MQKLAVIALFSSSLLGCMNKDDTVSVESALDDNESTAAEGEIMASSMDGAEMAGLLPATSDQVAAKIVSNIGPRFQPAGCATATSQGATVTVTYNDCTGPRGLIHVSGQLVLVVNVDANGTITVHGTSGDLSANDAHLKVDVDATYTVSGTSHMLDVQTNGSAVGPRGFELDHVGDYTKTWDTGTQCGGLDGSWATDATLVDGTNLHRSTTVDVTKCLGSCPNGTIERTFKNGVTLTITFDGTSTAKWSTTNGKSGTRTLPCL
jgi:hypothetical protein